MRNFKIYITDALPSIYFESLNQSLIEKKVALYFKRHSEIQAFFFSVDELTAEELLYLITEKERHLNVRFYGIVRDKKKVTFSRKLENYVDRLFYTFNGRQRVSNEIQQTITDFYSNPWGLSIDKSRRLLSRNGIEQRLQIAEFRMFRRLGGLSTSEFKSINDLKAELNYKCFKTTIDSMKSLDSKLKKLGLEIKCYETKYGISRNIPDSIQC